MATPDPPSVILVRHGSTEFNDPKNEVLRGLIDVPLSEKGREEATKAAASLKGTRASEIVTSPLQRASHTAREIAKVVKAPVRVDKRLCPWDTGVLSGLPMKAVKNVLQQGLSDPDFVLPGGESFKSFITRWRAALAEIMKRSQTAGLPAIIITSHSNLLSIPSALFDHQPGTVSDGPPHPGEAFRLPVPAHLLVPKGAGR